MVDVLILLWTALTSLFRSRARLEAEILVLRQQINVLRRKSPKRPSFSNFDRLLFVWLSRLVPATLDALNRSSAGDSDRLAPCGVPSLLALEIATTRRTAEKATADTPAYPRHEH